MSENNEAHVEVLDIVIKGYVVSVNGKKGKVVLTSEDVGAIALKNLIKQWSSQLSDDNVPSEKLVKNALDNLDLTKLDKKPNGTINLIDGNNKISISYIPESILGTLKYKGTWNASTINSVVGVGGNYYICTISGNYDPSGKTGQVWSKGDWAIYNDVTGKWDKIDAQNEVISVNGKVGAVVLTSDDIEIKIDEDTIEKKDHKFRAIGLKDEEDNLITAREIIEALTITEV